MICFVRSVGFDDPLPYQVAYHLCVGPGTAAIGGRLGQNARSNLS
jgi:hypothetical protein